MIKVMLTVLFISTTALGLDMSEGTFIHISDEINWRMIEYADKLNDAEGGNVNMLITSPGGSVIAGTIFISAMELAQKRGVKFTCLVPIVAASMAMHIFSYCDKMYALPKAYLLFHEGSTVVRGRATAKQLETSARQLRLLTKVLDIALRNKLGISKAKYRYWNEQSLLIPASVFRRLFPAFKLHIVNGDVKVPEGVNIFQMGL